MTAGLRGSTDAVPRGPARQQSSNRPSPSIRTADAPDPLDDSICRTAIRRLGLVDARVARAVEAINSYDGTGGVWYWLRVLQAGRSEWTAVARRRTKSELLTVAATIVPLDLDGKHVRGSGPT